MGGAYVGLADDVNSVFLNPAGLANLKSWQVMSMTTKLLNVIDYVSLAGTYNTEYGTFGLGYIGANLGGSFITGLSIVEDRGIIFPVTTSESIDYTSSVILIAYGVEPKRFLNYDFLEKVSVGATFKLFSQGLSGGGITDGTISGYDMDLGILYRPLPWLSTGLVQLDCLPESMGGKLVDSSGERIHILPSITKLGLAVNLFGPKDSLYDYPQPVIYLLDIEYMSTISSYPALLKSGAEWWPSSFLALRLGFDQDIVGNANSTAYEIETNMTAGVGIQYNGFKFDYAYHKYGIVTENETSFLSLSYMADIFIPGPEEEEKVPMQYISLVNPQDKTITRDEAIVFIGTITDTNKIRSLLINNGDVKFSSNGTFEVSYPLVLGKNSFEIKALDENDTIIESQKIRVLRLSSFRDVAADYWTKDSIESLATLGIIGGYPDGTFRPEKMINRAELTTLLVKAKGVSSTETTNTSFGDVTRKHWASFYIKSGADLGLVTGYPDGTFRPFKTLNRAEGVTILSRFAQLKEPDILLEGPFPDVPGRHWAAKSITASRSAGMLQYLLDKAFEPSRDMTRAEAAEILAKTPFASKKINDLKDFDTY